MVDGSRVQKLRALVERLPHAEHRLLDGQSHNVSPGALAPVLRQFFEAT
jgi:hypothetical protein